MLTMLVRSEMGSFLAPQTTLCSRLQRAYNFDCKSKIPSVKFHPILERHTPLRRSHSRLGAGFMAFSCGRSATRAEFA